MNARDYLAVLREKKVLIGAVLAACLLAAYGATMLMPKQYASQVTVFVAASGTGTDASNPATNNLQGAQLSTERVKSYVELMTGRRVAEDAARALGDVSPDDVSERVSATSTADTVIITLTATDRSPQRAHRIATAVTDSTRQLVSQLESGGPGQPPAVGVHVVQAASLPQSAMSPLLSVNLIIGGLLGVLLGFGAAITRHTLDQTVRSPTVLRRLTGAPVVGEVPEDTRIKRFPIAMPGEPTEARTEAFRRIRINLRPVGQVATRQTLLITSALPEDGRTLVACNLATALAAVGRRVLLLEADMRLPRVAEYLQLPPSPGLAEVLDDGASLPGALQRWRPGQIDVLTSGGPSVKANELLSGARAKVVFDQLRDAYDHIVVDSPALLPVADAAVVGDYADAALVVALWGRTRIQHLTAATDGLAAAGVPVVGAVLNRVPRKDVRPWSYPSSPAPAYEDPGQQLDQDPSTLSRTAPVATRSVDLSRSRSARLRPNPTRGGRRTSSPDEHRG